jgi:class 3 adenylate cyclase
MQIHTYEVQGVNARYVGPGDLHEPEQTKMGYTATLNPYMPPPPPTFNLTDLRLRLDQLQNQTISNRNGTTANATQLQADLQAILQSEERKRNNKNQTAAAALTKNETAASQNNGLICQHVLTIYPTAEYANSHTSNDPTVYTIALVCIISFAVFLFLVYDFVVRRQQNKVLGEAERSNAIIASLFPTQVARKLFDHAGGHALPVGGAQGGGRGTDAAMGNSDHGARGGRKHRSRNSGGGPGGSSSDLDPSAMMNKGGMGGRPIAELFPEATVMFADIAGFTAWSSIREPTQVFELLEAIFQSFDTIANRRGVFKVETVGDCYVAVCGVPEPCADHAVVMARFARECLSKCEKVLQSLELKLGPDTGDLAMRFGLNSGPVTAGVLRGDRARFQLFGDTVNTAARIESTGKRERIHLSESTANLIIASGKPDWVTPREEYVLFVLCCMIVLCLSLERGMRDPVANNLLFF